MAHDLIWFKERIGKRIFRDSDGCDCKCCIDVVENGIIVSDLEHAQYLAMIDIDLEAEGIKLNYRDNK